MDGVVGTDGAGWDKGRRQMGDLGNEQAAENGLIGIGKPEEHTRGAKQVRKKA